MAKSRKATTTRQSRTPAATPPIEPPTRPPTKLATIAGLISRPAGASLAELMKATGWQAHSVRGCLAGSIKRQMKLALTSEQIDGQRIYRVAAPAAG